MHTLAYFMLGLGIALLVAGLLLGGLPKMPPPVWSALLGGLGLMAAADWGRRSLTDWTRDRKLRRACRYESEYVASLTPLLMGEYPEYVIEAATQLGESRDPSAVPALMRVLESCLDMQRVGWCEIAEAVVNALAKIGDRRSLALLYQIENVRGIGIITQIRAAIAAIEPQTSLLRPSGMETLPEMLLRPAQGRQSPEEAALLLRAVESDPR
jgi:hypothetical protein